MDKFGNNRGNKKNDHKPNDTYLKKRKAIINDGDMADLVVVCAKLMGWKWQEIPHPKVGKVQL